MLILSEYRKFERPALRSKNAKEPPSAPPRKKRRRGRKERGRSDWKRQIDAQDVPIAPARKVDMQRILAARLLRNETEKAPDLRSL